LFRSLTIKGDDMHRNLTPSEKSMLRQDTIERAAKELTRSQIDAMKRIRDRGPGGWCFGRGRAGGAVSRMFDRLCAAGLMKGPPFELTPFGEQVLAHLNTTLHAKGD
jgi:hypothetical protein